MSSPAAASTPAAAVPSQTAVPQKTPQKTPQRHVDDAVPSIATPRSVATPHAPILSPSGSRTGADVSAQNGKTLRTFGTPGRANGAGFISNARGNTPSIGSKTVLGAGKTPAGLSNSTFFQGSPPGLPSSFDSPSAMMALDSSVGSAPMGLSMSNLGLGLGFATGMGASASAQSTGSGKLDDAERRRRLETVSTMIGKRPNRISQEGIERLARRLFREVDKEEAMGSNQNTTFVMAGNNVAVIVEFKEGESSGVEKLDLQYEGLSEAVSEHAEAGAAILKKDLEILPGTTSLNATLERFANNLERLSRMDKLSVPGANCFEAVNGVYTSLRRLYEHERKAAEILQKADMRDGTSRIEHEVLRKKSGRPRMHAHRKLGLSVDYWTEGNVENSAQTRDSNARDNEEDSNTLESDPAPLYSITVDCEHTSPVLYPTIRSSEDWLPPSIVKAKGTNNNGLDNSLDNRLGLSDSNSLKHGEQSEDVELNWQTPSSPVISTVEPDPLTSTTTENGTLGSARSQARFVAHPEPSVTLPLHLASQLYASVGVDLSQDPTLWQAQPSWDGIVFPSTSLFDSKYIDGSLAIFSPRCISCFKSVSTPEDSASKLQSQKSWTANLHIPSSTLTVPAYTIQSLPFHHPRQIIEALPTLRQWAFLTRLLRKCFGTPDAVDQNNSAPNQYSGSARSVNGEAHNQSAADDEAFLNSLIAPGESLSPPTPRILDVSLHIPQTPRHPPSDGQDFAVHYLQGDSTPELTVTMPYTRSVYRVKIKIGLNGDITCSLNNAEESYIGDADIEMSGQDDAADLDEEEAKQRRQKREKILAQGLTICEDLVMWTEWVRTKVLGLE